MAIGWLSLLKHVPWTDVIANAPVVADGAKKLWSAAARRPPPPTEEPAPEAVAQIESREAEAIAALQARVATVERDAADLRQQLLASSELINALAEQNTELVRRVETHRVRVVWLSAAVGVAGVLALAALALPLLR